MCELVQDRRTPVSHTEGCPAFQAVPRSLIAILCTHAASWIPAIIDSIQ